MEVCWERLDEKTKEAVERIKAVDPENYEYTCYGAGHTGEVLIFDKVWEKHSRPDIDREAARYFYLLGGGDIYGFERYLARMERGEE